MKDDWQVNLTDQVATNGAFKLSFYDTEDGGFSISVMGDSSDLSEAEKFALLHDGMEAIGRAKFGGGGS